MLCQCCALSVFSFEKRSEVEMEKNLAISALETNFMTILLNDQLSK